MLSSRSTALVSCAALLLGGTLAGCGDKSDTTQGAYGAPAGDTAQTTPAQTTPAQTMPAPPASVAAIPSDGAPGQIAMLPPPVPPTADGQNSGKMAPPLNPDAPFAGGMGGDPNAPLTPTPGMDKKIAALQTGDKVAYAEALADRGYARMTDENAGRKIKYREALADFNAALQADPNNAKARENKDTIESIYKSMGRPIPGTEGTK